MSSVKANKILPNLKVLFGQKFAEARLKKNWTQRHLAKELGIRQQSLNNIEQGRMLPDEQTLAQACMLLEDKLDRFLPPRPVKRGPGRPQGPSKVLSKPKPDSIAARIKARRLACGLSQAELGARVGLPQPYFTKIETGDKIPKPDTLIRIAEALECDPTQIDPQIMLGMAGSKPPVNLIWSTLKNRWVGLNLEDRESLVELNAPTGIVRSELAKMSAKAVEAKIAIILRGDLPPRSEES